MPSFEQKRGPKSPQQWCLRVLVEDLEDDAADDEGEQNSVELVLLTHLRWLFLQEDFFCNQHTFLFYLENIFQLGGIGCEQGNVQHTLRIFSSQRRR